VAAGHEIACHGLQHRYLDRSTEADKREEIFTGKAKLEDAFGKPCLGFRAPGYSIDFRSLELLREAGYLYDSSIWPNYRFRTRLGIQRLLPEPFALWPEDPFFEIPLPAWGPLWPPFHPSYAFYLRLPFFRRMLRAFSAQRNYFTLLFHLTDFAARQPRHGGTRIQIFTNNYFSGAAKLRFLDKLTHEVKSRYAVVTTEDFLRGWPDSAPDLNPRTILGIATTHETGACVVQDGVVLSAVNEERLSRRKLDNSYPPEKSIREAIRVAGIDAAEIDAVAIAGLHWRDLIPQSWDSFVRDAKDFHALNDYVPHLVRVFYRLLYFWRALHYGKVLDFLKAELGVEPKPFYVEHHEAHAASVYRTTDWDRALIATADGVGDDVSITYSIADGSLIRRIETFFYPNSFGQFYTACTQVLGFKGGRHEGKITGLSGYGTHDPGLADRVRRTFFVDDGGFRLNKKYYSEGFVRVSRANLKVATGRGLGLIDLDYRNYKPPLRRLLSGYAREQVAYAYQAELESQMTRLTERHWSPEHRNLGLAGGIFANVKLNMALSESLVTDGLFVFPAMGDGGLCVGAALSVRGEKPRRIPHVYLGTSIEPDEALTELQTSDGVSWTRPDDMAQVAAEALAANLIVARCAGAMEYGPRALGNRSILYHCADPHVNDWLNEQLGRTEFMPFAPICLAEDAREYFHLRAGEELACAYMTLVVRCTDRMMEECPAAVHVDGTARPQLIDALRNPEMHEILVRYRELTGVSCVINTSFNMHEEPIVRSPADGIKAFLQSNLDRLVLGPYFVHNDRKCASDKTPS
jgi:carbamoyltransferase